MPDDLRTTAQHQSVLGHLRALHEPGFGRASRLREPHVTLDGARTVVTAEVLADLEGPARTALFTAADGRLRQITAGGGSARGARFSPDGRTLAFLADRAEEREFQLHLLEDGLGEAVPAPRVPGTIEYLHWSPDGRRILLGVAGLGADLSGGQGAGTNHRGTDEAPSWFPRVTGRATAEAWRSLWLYTPDTGTVEQLSPDGLNCWEAGWCGPDRVAAITSDAPGEGDWYTAVLSLIDLSGTPHRALSSEVQLGLPVGSPDGRSLAVVEAVCSDRWLVAGDLLLLDTESGAVRRIDTAGTDVTRLQWLDFERIGYFGVRHLDSVAGVVRTADGSVSEVLATANAYGGSTFHPDGAFTEDGGVLTIEESYELPQQLVLSGLDGHHRVLASTAHQGTDYLRSVAGSARALVWNAPDGTEIEGILCTPAGDGPFPLVVNIHGGPVWGFRNTWSMSAPWVSLLVSRGYAVLNPNPRGSSGRGQDFAGLVVGDMGGADAHDLLAGIDALVARGLADPSRIGLIGGSYGGYMSSWLTTQDTRFAAAVPIAPVTDWYSQSFTSNIAAWGYRFLDGGPEQPGSQAHTRSPVVHAGKARTPCLVVAGALDNCTPPGQAQEFHQALRAQGVPSTLVVYPEEGHGVRSYPAQVDLLTRVLDCFECYMPATSATGPALPG